MGRQRRHHVLADHSVLGRFEVKEGGRVTASGGRKRTELVLSVLDVDSVLSHGGQLSPLGHEHYQKYNGRGGNEAEAYAGVLMTVGQDQSRHGPNHPHRNHATDGQTDVSRLSIIVTNTSRFNS